MTGITEEERKSYRAAAKVYSAVSAKEKSDSLNEDLTAIDDFVDIIEDPDLLSLLRAAKKDSGEKETIILFGNWGKALELSSRGLIFNGKRIDSKVGTLKLMKLHKFDDMNVSVKEFLDMMAGTIKIVAKKFVDSAPEIE